MAAALVNTSHDQSLTKLFVYDKSVSAPFQPLRRLAPHLAMLPWPATLARLGPQRKSRSYLQGSARDRSVHAIYVHPHVWNQLNAPEDNSALLVEFVNSLMLEGVLAQGTFCCHHEPSRCTASDMMVTCLAHRFGPLQVELHVPLINRGDSS
eukprot:6487078-Amphidinium_carterae.1